MHRLIRRGLTMLAAASTCAVLMPAPAAQANHVLSLCDNDGGGGTTLLSQTVVLPSGLGVVDVHIGTQQDSWVSYDGPGTPFDTLVGVDLGTVNLAENMLVCFRVLDVSYFVLVNAVNLDVQLCSWAGEPGHGGELSCITVI